MFTKTFCESYQCALLVQAKYPADNSSNITTTTVAATTTTTTTSNAIERHQIKNLLRYKNKNLQRFITFLILNLIMWHECLRTVSAAPQSCILCDKDDIEGSKIKDPRNTYEEFLFEHQVTRQDAINALKSLNQSFYNEPSTESSCNAIICSNDIKKYCLGPQFINDHCWCELGHNNEGLPFVPHICYVGEKAHKAFGGSCFLYEEVKECCCASVLAKQWRHISSSERSLPNLILTSIVLLITYLLVI